MYPSESIQVSTPKLSKFIVWQDGFPRKLQTAKTNNWLSLNKNIQIGFQKLFYGSLMVL